MFLSTIDRQLDGKRRIVLPADFRAAATGLFEGVFCFPSFEAPCIEGGGQKLFDTYKSLIEEMPFGDPLRTALETTVFGSMHKLAWDPNGRITLPEAFCEEFGISEWVSVVGLGERFQIWPKEAFAAHSLEQRRIAAQGLPALRAQQRQARLAVSA